MKRKQDAADMAAGPDENEQWYKHCFLCKTWGLDTQEGHTHKVYMGGGIINDHWICQKCWNDRCRIKVRQEKDKHDDDGGGDDEENKPDNNSKRALRRTDTLPPIPDKMEVDG